jgi:hypothetical protein
MIIHEHAMRPVDMIKKSMYNSTHRQPQGADHES